MTRGAAVERAAAEAPPSPPVNVLIVYNPTAGGRRGRHRFRATLRHLQRLGCRWTVRETAGPGDAERLVREADADPVATYDLVVAAGGDGTVNEVIAGLDGSEVPLGLVPLGTANVLAAEIGLGRRPAAMAAAIAGGRTRPIHLGIVNDRRFAVMAGIGFDAHVVTGVTPALKRVLGRAAYVWRSLCELLRGPTAGYRVTIDDRIFEASTVIVANGHFYGGRYVCAPEARLEEPLLHVVLFESSGRWNALRYLLAMLTGRLARLPDVQVIATETLTVDGPPGEPVQADGDVVAVLPARFSVDPATLPLLRPWTEQR